MTRKPAFYDGVYEFLTNGGLQDESTWPCEDGWFGSH
jgi:hypothetical protein